MIPSLERGESNRCLVPLESILGLDSGTDKVEVTPDAAPLTGHRKDMDTFARHGKARIPVIII